jgi:uncharacterized protein
MSAAAEQKTTEPSMEEILASIRRIISDDQQQSTPAVVQAPVVAVAPPAAPKIVEQVKIEPMVVASVATPLQVAKVETAPVRNIVQVQEPEEDVLELMMPETELSQIQPVATPDFVVTRVQEPVVSFAPVTAKIEAQPDTSLIGGQTDKLVSNSFNSLAHTVLSQNARTIDDVVKDMLRPMLKTWLDDNLPNIVERLVRSEIERVTRGSR